MDATDPLHRNQTEKKKIKLDNVLRAFVRSRSVVKQCLYLCTGIRLPKTGDQCLWQKAVRSVLDDLGNVRSMYRNLYALETLGVVGPYLVRM